MLPYLRRKFKSFLKNTTILCKETLIPAFSNRAGPSVAGNQKTIAQIQHSSQSFSCLIHYPVDTTAEKPPHRIMFTQKTTKTAKKQKRMHLSVGDD